MPQCLYSHTHTHYLSQTHTHTQTHTNIHAHATADWAQKERKLITHFKKTNLWAPPRLGGGGRKEGREERVGGKGGDGQREKGRWMERRLGRRE